jgi:hypothetical protein
MFQNFVVVRRGGGETRFWSASAAIEHARRVGGVAFFESGGQRLQVWPAPEPAPAAGGEPLRVASAMCSAIEGLLPSTTAAPIGTGGGCMALEVRDDRRPGWHILVTDGDAGLPVGRDGGWSSRVFAGAYPDDGSAGPEDDASLVLLDEAGDGLTAFLLLGAISAFFAPSVD